MSEVIERATLEVVDAVACTVLGASHPLARRVAGAGRGWRATGPHRSFAGSGLALEDAVRLDALACHVDELDSIDPAAAVVPGALVVPAALHAALLVGASGARLLDAVVAGYDVLATLGRSIGGAEAYTHGWWPTSTVGAVGAAAAVARVLDLPQESYADALGLAAASVGGLLSADALGAGHYLSAADASVAGLRAALLAADGLDASHTYLTGPNGPATRALGSWRELDPLAPGTGVLSVATKPYPCARPLQGVVAALTGASLSGVASIEIELPAPLLRFVSAEVDVRDATAAAASAVHVVAACREGRAEDARFFRRASLSGLDPLPSVRLRAWDDAPAGSWGCRVLVDGTVLVGEPPVLAGEEIAAKAVRTLGHAGIALGPATEAVEVLSDLAACPDVRDLRLHERLSPAA